MKKSVPILLSLLALGGAMASLSSGCAGTPTSDSTGEYIDDSAITTKVKSKLIGDETVKAREIDVNTFKGVVQLSGFVDTPEQKSRAAELAASVPGVRNVQNNIAVKTAAAP